MKVAFVHPPPFRVDFPPLGVPYLSASLKESGHKVSSFDFNLELYTEGIIEKKFWRFENSGCWKQPEILEQIVPDKKIEEFAHRIIKSGAELVGISVHVDSFFLANKISRALKEKNSQVRIIYGGPYFSRQMFRIHNLSDGSLSKDVDAYVIGEGEITLSEIVNQLEAKNELDDVKGAFIKKNGKIIDCGPRENFRELDRLPFPDFSEFHPSKYLEKTTLPILFSRGCINHCSFCRDCVIWGTYRNRSAENIVAEMKEHSEKFSAKCFNCADLMINGNLKMLDELAELLIKEDLNVEWGGMALGRASMSQDLLNKLKKAGCIHLDIGVESGSNRVLTLIGKSNLKMSRDLIKKAYRAGIKVHTMWLIGHSGETMLDFFKTLYFLFQNRKYFEDVLPNLCHIPIESKLFENMQKMGIAIDNDSCYDTMKWYVGKNNLKERNRRQKIFMKFAHLAKIPLRDT